MIDKSSQDWFEEYYNIIDNEQNASEWENFKNNIIKKNYNQRFVNNSNHNGNGLSKRLKKSTNNNILSNQAVTFNGYDFSDKSESKDFEKFDHKIKKNIAKNKLKIQAVVDLHSLTIAQAQKVIYEFINDSFQNKLKYLLIITGKGSLKSETKTLRSEFKNFMNQANVFNKIVSFTYASRQHGDFGAYYVVLKKNI